MGILYHIKLYAWSVSLFLLLDLVWLGLVARSFYQRHLADLLSPSVKWSAAIGFYLVYVAGILIFAVAPALERDSVGRAALLGCLFGFFTYATYDFTNLATLKGWPLRVVVVDVLWGSFLGSAVASGSFLVGKWLS